MRLKPPYQFLPLKYNTLRFKISIVYVSVIGIILFLIQGFFYLNYVHSVSSDFDTQLHNKAEQLGGAVNTFQSMLDERTQTLHSSAQKAVNLSIEYPNYIFMLASPEKFWLADARKLGLDHDYLVIIDDQGNIIGNSKNVDNNLFLYFKKIGKRRMDKDKYYKVLVNGNILRIIVMPYYYTFNQKFYVAVATPYGPIERILLNHFYFMLFSTLIFLFIASLVIRVFVISVLSSVMEISNAARNISQENLGARIKLTHADQEIEHLTNSLNEMIARLDKSFAHIKEFSLEMAHEVKTPLAIISGESQMALEKECSSDEYKEILKTIIKEARRTQSFVSDLLLLTKLDYRLIEMRFEPIDLSEFLREICLSMQVIAVAKGVDIHREIPLKAISIKGDNIHLQRVFVNLIDNALKFTPAGGKIDVVLKLVGQKAVIIMSDTGPGISEDEQHKIFNKFYRVSPDDPENTAGCGLGLSIVYSIIQLHRGTVTVISEQGKGATFSIEIPLE